MEKEYKNLVLGCQNCKKDFTIEPDDFLFYEKIKVPPPTFCPECRLVRRLMWRNEHSLFRRQNAEEGKDNLVISIYHPDAKIKTYDKEMWWSDKWDSSNYGRDYDFSISFFEQFKKLMVEVPHIALSDSKSIDSRFCNITVEMKNCYLVTAAWTCEDSMYCNRISGCKFTNDSYICYNTEFGYENVYCRDSSKLFFSLESESCLESYFLYDCRNCSNCILCANLRNKSYCIENIQYSKEEYFKYKNKLSLNTRDGIENAQKKFEQLYNNALHRDLKLLNTVNVIGDHVENSRNCYGVFDVEGDYENVKYANWGTKKLRDSYDIGPGCGGGSELTYEGISIGVTNNRCCFGAIVWYSSDVYYSFMMNNCKNCFGCTEMNGKQYCILNKQYGKEEYFELLTKIKEHMMSMPYVDNKGRIYKYGEFFPAEISPFSYNETVAQDYFPIDSKKAELEGYLWRESVSNSYAVTILGKDIPQTVSEVDDSILNEVIECEITKKPFKINEQELDFYRRFDLPIPTVHPDERHNRRLKLRNKMVLNNRKCYLGDEDIITTYEPEPIGPQKVICNDHYKKEIY